MKLSRTVVYGLQAIVQLARMESDTPVTCRRISAGSKMPERFLLHVLRKMVIHGILASTRGSDGGYELRRKPADISLLDVIEAIDGPIRADMPDRKHLFTSAADERLQSAIDEVTSTMRRQLRELSLADLLLASSEEASKRRSRSA